MSISSTFKKFKRYILEDDGVYHLESDWTSSHTVEFDDGQTAEYKVGRILTRLDSDLEVILSTANWTASSSVSGYYEQRINVPSVTSSQKPLWGLQPVNNLVPTDTEINIYNNIVSMVTGNKLLTFYASEKPAANINIIVKGVGTWE